MGGGASSPPSAALPVEQATGAVRSPRKRGGSGRDRFPFIDQFRGLVGVMMALGHSSGFFNSVWKSLDMFDPLFPNWGQFALRYMGYLCAPGFLMMNGAVSWYSFTRRVGAGHSGGSARWHLVQRGLFLILVQVTWVNSAWIGFRRLNLPHLGIIATIGISMCILALFLHWKWWQRLLVGLGAFLLHPVLLTIQYDPQVWWQMVIMQTFVDAGWWNKYPVIPWFGLAVMGSVMAQGWFGGWKSTRQRVLWSWGIGLGAIAVAAGVRLLRGWGNSTDFYQFFHISFFLDAKYPPNLFHNLWFFGSVAFMVGTIHFIGQFAMPLVRWLGTVGRVPLFFYCVHIAVLSVIADRFGVFYREGAVAGSLLGLVALLAVMYPLSIWFGRVKARSKNKLIQLI